MDCKKLRLHAGSLEFRDQRLMQEYDLFCLRVVTDQEGSEALNKH